MVYTPALLDEGIYIANLTVPEGLFWSDIINPPGNRASSYLYIQRRVDKNPKPISCIPMT